MRYPAFLKEKGTIGFVAPSFGCATEPYKSGFMNAQRRWREQGYHLRLGPNCYVEEGVGISNTPAKCAEELTTFYCDKNNDCLISCGGGELMCEILDYVDFEKIKARCIVSQREVGSDTMDYASGLRACLREAPDVIVLGEMRDPETIRTAMTAAETGHLVLATLHTDGAAKTIDRIIDAFPGDQQEQIRAQLSMVLEAVVCQKLLPGKNGGQVPAYEIMRRTDSIATMIRDNKTKQIDNDIASGGELGMIRMDKYIQNLYAEGQITAETAVRFAEDQEKMKRKLGSG